MGANLQSFMADGMRKGYQARRQEFQQSQRQHQSKSKFGQTSTRLGGLTSEQIGDAPQPLKFGRGILGDYARNMAARDGIPVEEPRFGARSSRRRGLGFGGDNAKLG